MIDDLTPDDITRCYQIGAKPLCQYQAKIECLENNPIKNRCGPFYTECSLHINEKKYIDTGCEVSSLFPDYIWDYENQIFREEINSNYFEKYKNELKILKNSLNPVDSVDINTGNGICDKLLLEFKEPIYVGIKDLEPVPIYYFLVNKEGPTEELQTLIGLDILTQYDLYLTKDGNKPVIMNNYPESNSTTNSSQVINKIFDNFF